MITMAEVMHVTYGKKLPFTPALPMYRADQKFSEKWRPVKKMLIP